MLAAEDKKSYKTDALVFKTLYYGAERSSKLYIRVPLYRCTSMYIGKEARQSAGFSRRSRSHGHGKSL